ncbi:hypothetical protein G7Y79_00012g033530 [Physcia stellaris]|nr:hypothetical protein G7Y79_00012g033530 [Physcia stellaris]
MYFSLFALGALAFFDLATTSVAGHARFHHVQPRHPRIATLKDAQRANSRRSNIDGRDTSPVLVTMSDLQLLQQEATAFAGWMNSWFESAQTLDSTTAASQLKQELQAYQGWINTWLDTAMNTSAAPSIPSPVPITSRKGATVSLALPTTLVTPIAPLTSSLAVSSSPNADIPISVASSSSLSPSQSSSSAPAAGLFQKPRTQHFHPTSTTASSSPVVQVPVVSTSAASLTTTTADVVTPTPSPSTPESSSGYSFNADSSSNLAVYYGQSPATAQVPLSKICGDDNVDIVILAFLTTFFGPAGYPSINFGSACGGQSTKMKAMGATGLQSCPNLASEIKSCQSAGKKVLLSLGGSLATSAFSSDDQASKFATTLWDLFGAGTGSDAGLRPFGEVALDGFDVDNEDHSTASYSTFVSALRNTMDADSSKKYYISAAPQCPRPDASIPLDAMQSMDFVFVQFYNNGNCNVGQPGFADSFKAWSQDLGANGKGPKLYIGAPGCSSCAGSGYVDPGQVGSVMSAAKAAGVSNFGGVMLWDGSEAMVNMEGGKDYLSVVKGALGA